ncbi:hypothetical protein [Raoultella ornithinolytica]|uniref:hypothetical protein n=1 Tax=Raoultella ornithinolytica TaxID=54291 RepID=UPI0010D6CE96|nr:hypothetical protein [Raoultella ornithinolytica]VTN41421.1 Uncharacterised protein [Raoultella ornithinolytica]
MTSKLNINWLNKCRCGNRMHTVETVRGSHVRLFEDDAVKCNSCGREGVIQTCDGIATVLWETDAERAEGEAITKLTREENVQAVFDLKAGYTLGLADVEILKRVARMALAAMDSEPVYQHVINHPHSDGYKKWEDCSEFFYKGVPGYLRRVLYRQAQPAVDSDFIPKNLDKALGVLGMAIPESREEFNFQTERWIQRLIDRVIRYADEFQEQPAPVVMEGLNPETTDLVLRFASALADKLYKAEQKYGRSTDWMKDDWYDDCLQSLWEHIEKGDPRDVAAYCAFMWYHGWVTTDYDRNVQNACRAAMLQAGTLTNEDTKQAWTGIPDIDNAINMLDRIDTLESCDDDRIEAVKTVLRRLAGNSPVIPDGLIAAVNRLLDSDGSRGCYSAIRCYDARAEVERLLAAAPQEVK